jgi:uncharacterized protein (TIGR02147 family)
MDIQTPYYVQKLKEDLSLKQRRSPSYSLRAYARDLDLHPATLSLLFNGKRGLPGKKSLAVADKLGLRPKERTLFLESLHRAKTKLDQIVVREEDERFMLDDSYHTVIAEWEHYAVLTLFDCAGLVINKEYISLKLGITLNRAEVVLANLSQCGLLVENDGEWQKTHAKVRTTEDVTSQALRDGHLETLEMGKDKLQDVDVQLRDFSSIMLAMDPEKLMDAKMIIREFRQKMAALLGEGQRSEVYQLAIQFYPLTQMKKEGVLS